MADGNLSMAPISWVYVAFISLISYGLVDVNALHSSSVGEAEAPLGESDDVDDVDDFLKLGASFSDETVMDPPREGADLVELDNYADMLEKKLDKVANEGFASVEQRFKQFEKAHTSLKTKLDALRKKVAERDTKTSQIEDEVHSIKSTKQLVHNMVKSTRRLAALGRDRLKDAKTIAENKAAESTIKSSVATRANMEDVLKFLRKWEDKADKLMRHASGLRLSAADKKVDYLIQEIREFSEKTRGEAIDVSSLSDAGSGETKTLHNFVAKEYERLSNTTEDIKSLKQRLTSVLRDEQDAVARHSNNYLKKNHAKEYVQKARKGLEKLDKLEQRVKKSKKKVKQIKKANEPPCNELPVPWPTPKPTPKPTPPPVPWPTPKPTPKPTLPPVSWPTMKPLPLPPVATPLPVPWPTAAPVPLPPPSTTTTTTSTPPYVRKKVPEKEVEKVNEMIQKAKKKKDHLAAKVNKCKKERARASKDIWANKTPEEKLSDKKFASEKRELRRATEEVEKLNQKKKMLYSTYSASSLRPRPLVKTLPPVPWSTPTPAPRLPCKDAPGTAAAAQAELGVGAEIKVKLGADAESREKLGDDYGTKKMQPTSGNTSTASAVIETPAKDLIFPS
eukprot:TRINITY_DN43071_c0_g1_i1.p1 TRINITY_DN43071_c0_g1~~TRINITY_DN43071_c0_g1_i1.p1  ORF type:complete len:620 (+),score=131.09 TRINITY_DN43071_c0_g1_i1:76-1935(+)